MRIAGIDTATMIGSVGLVEDGRIVLEDFREAVRGHGQTLAPMFRDLLSGAGWAAGSLDAIAVSIGPGSFTGLRVGLAFAKGIVFAAGTALVPVPTLDALAAVASASPGELICPVLDARREDVYAGTYFAPPNGYPQMLSDPVILPVGGLIDRVRGYLRAEERPPRQAVARDHASAVCEGRCRFLGDGVIRHGDRIGRAFGDRALVLPFTHYHPAGGTVALLGAERLAAGLTAEPGSLEPAYLRPSYAEGNAAKAGKGRGHGGVDAR